MVHRQRETEDQRQLQTPQSGLEEEGAGGPRSHSLGASLGSYGGKESKVLADEPLSTLCRTGSEEDGSGQVGDSKWVTAGEAR